MKTFHRAVYTNHKHMCSGITASRHHHVGYDQVPSNFNRALRTLLPLLRDGYHKVCFRLLENKIFSCGDFVGTKSKIWYIDSYLLVGQPVLASTAVVNSAKATLRIVTSEHAEISME